MVYGIRRFVYNTFFFLVLLCASGLASLIPITTWEVWFITIFPCIFLTFQPIRAVADVYDLYTRKKQLFWGIQILLVLTITLSMQTIVQTFL